MKATKLGGAAGRELVGEWLRRFQCKRQTTTVESHKGRVFTMFCAIARAHRGDAGRANPTARSPVTDVTDENVTSARARAAARSHRSARAGRQAQGGLLPAVVISATAGRWLRR